MKNEKTPGWFYIYLFEILFMLMMAVMLLLVIPRMNVPLDINTNSSAFIDPIAFAFSIVMLLTVITGGIFSIRSHHSAKYFAVLCFVNLFSGLFASGAIDANFILVIIFTLLLAPQPMLFDMGFDLISIWIDGQIIFLVWLILFLFSIVLLIIHKQKQNE